MVVGSKTIENERQNVSQTFAVEQKHFYTIGAIFLISRLALLWYNEAEFTDAYEFIQWSLFEPTKRHPLYPLLIQSFAYLMDPIIAGRLISSLAGLCCLPSLVKISKKLHGPVAALICCLFFTVSPQILFVNTRVLSESLYLAVTLAAIAYFLDSFDEQPKEYDFLLTVLFFGLSILTRPEGIILVPLIFFAAVSLVRRKLWKNLIYSILGLLPWLLYFLWARFQSNAGYQSELAFSFRTGTTTKFLTYLFAYIDVYPYSAFFPVFVLAFLGIFHLSDSSRKRWLYTLLYFHVTIFAAIAIHQAWSTRFLLLPLSLLLIEASGTLQRLIGKISARAWKTLALGIVLSSLTFAVAALYFQRETYADVKQTGLYIRDQAKGERVFSDEIIKMTYYAGRPVHSYQPGAIYTPGDLIALHSFHTPVVAEFKRLADRHELEFVFSAESKIMPVLANTLLNRQRTNLPIAMTERFRFQEFYSAIARVKSIRPPVSIEKSSSNTK